MKAKYQHIILGVLIILIGVLLLLHNFRVLYLDDQLFWGIALIILGMIFIRVYNRTSPRKSILILGILFLLIGLFTTLDAIIFVPEDLIGTFFLWIGGAIFLSIYIHKNERWWAIIPGGIFIILGFIVTLNAFRLLEGDILWFIFILGISLTFWFLYLIKDEKNKLNWAIYPAFLLTIFSFFILSLIWESQFADILFPISIIFSGAYLVIKNLWNKKQILLNSEQQEIGEKA
jgi:hypothetical protein